MKTILITRPVEDAEESCHALSAKGFATFSEPLLRLEFLRENKTTLEAALGKKPQALLISSKRALEAFVAMNGSRTLPVYNVGAATARHAAVLGFAVAGYAKTAETLCEHIAPVWPPSAPLLYVRGEEVHTDIAAILKEKGLQVDSVIVYRAVGAQDFSVRLRGLLEGGGIDGILFFSRRSAEVYMALAHKHGLGHAHENMAAICMRGTVAQIVGATPWRSLRIAEEPDLDHMVKAAQAAF